MSVETTKNEEMYSAENWDVGLDRDVVESLEVLAVSNPDLYREVRKTLQKVVQNPFSGPPKTGELRGFRADHVRHLVVVWELRAEGNGNTSTNRSDTDELDELYIHGIEHHDEMVEAVKGERDPAPAERVRAILA